MSYNTTAPGTPVGTPGPDNLVAKEFVRLCFDTTGSQRPVYAWIQANNNNQVPGATSLFHAINKDDKLTVITDNGIGVVPSFRQLLSSGNIVQDPFAQTLSLDSLDVQTSYLIDTKDEYREIDDKKAREKFSRIKFDINNSQNVSKKVFEGLKAENIMPDDASLCEMVPIIIADVAQDGSLINSTVDGYMLKYGHSVNGKKISTDEKGDYLRVTVDKDGIFLVEKKWSKMKDEKNNAKKALAKTMSKSDIIISARAHVQSFYSTETVPQNAQSVQLEYSRESENSDELIPVYIVDFGQKFIKAKINAINGSIIK